MNGTNGVIQCAAGESPCILDVTNNCPSKLNFFKYFDIVRINVEGISNTFSYNVYCDSSYLSNTFEWGLLLEIMFCTVCIIVVAIYCNAWSISGAGISISPYWAIGLNIVVINGGIVAIFNLQVVNIAVLVLSWFFGTLGVALCTN